MQNIKKQFSDLKDQLDTAIVEGLDPQQGRLQAAMHYSLSLPGKRLRPLLFFSTVSALGADPLAHLDVASALEIIHTYSLIHDDLPCMDNDDLRRGMPTVHRRFDEATALLAGDTLLTWAFERLAAARGLDDKRIVSLIRLITHAIGVAGMAGGQALDLGFQSDAGVIPLIHRLKTAELIRASMEAAAIVSGADERQDPIGRCALTIGLAFQLADDLLDLEGDPLLVGKKLRKDAGNHSPNAAIHLGRDRVIADMETLYQNALKDLSHCRIDTPELKTLFNMMVYRTA
jgi:geranylgeranyl pyrophosphate synthase